MKGKKGEVQEGKKTRKEVRRRSNRGGEREEEQEGRKNEKNWRRGGREERAGTRGEETLGKR